MVKGILGHKLLLWLDLLYWKQLDGCVNTAGDLFSCGVDA